METYNQKNWVRRYLSHLFFCLVYFCHLIFVISSPVIGKMTKSSFLWMNWFIILFLNFFFRGFAAAVDSLTQVLGIYFYLKTFKLSSLLVITEPLSQYFEFIWQFTYLLLTSSLTAINCCLHFFFLPNGIRNFGRCQVWLLWILYFSITPLVNNKTQDSTWRFL